MANGQILLTAATKRMTDAGYVLAEEWPRLLLFRKGNLTAVICRDTLNGTSSSTFSLKVPGEVRNQSFPNLNQLLKTSKFLESIQGAANG